MDDASLNTPNPQGEVNLVNALGENDNITGEVGLGKGGRTKKFISFDSLKFEKERLETFIDWPVNWLKPKDLAYAGFIYLRRADHCACVFCRGIVGAWEYGDNPWEEHQRHFPQCPFIKGEPVGNIPYDQSMIISHITPSLETAPPLPLSMDLCGVGRPMPGSYPECKSPKRKDFLSLESREKSFMSWPDQVKQSPKELAEAGFFYCGLSDHVQCYHCGNGLRNWEKEDDPWVEHARWCPECNYVRGKKGQEFIDKVRRERPPYLQSFTAPETSSSSLTQPSITESELDLLMDLSIIKATLGMGFPVDKVRAALRRKLEQTGLPFFTLQACIDAVLQYMEQETRLPLQESSARSFKLEEASQQGAKMQSLEVASERLARASSSCPIPKVSRVNPPYLRSQTAPKTGSSSLAWSSITKSELDPLTELDNLKATLEMGFSVGNVQTALRRQRYLKFALQCMKKKTRPTLQESSARSLALEVASQQGAEMQSLQAASERQASASSSSIPTTTTTTSATTAGAMFSSPSTSSSSSGSSFSQHDPAASNTEEPMETESSPITSTHDALSLTNQVMGMASQAHSADPTFSSSPSPNPSAEPSLFTSASSTPTSPFAAISLASLPQATRATLSTFSNSPDAVMEKVAKKTVPSTEPSFAGKPQPSQDLAVELEKIKDSHMCKVCMDAEIVMVFLPCTHMVTCSSCALALAQCPICRAHIKYAIKPILS